MRVVAEYIFDSDRILVRLLGTVTPPSSVQTGTYTVNFFPTRAPFVFDVEADLIANNEAKIYISNPVPFPERLDVTLPDTTIVSVTIGDVKEPPVDKIIGEQKVETSTPRPTPIHYPAHAEYKPDTMAPPDFPPFWVELNFSNAEPLRLTSGSTSSLLTYTGGAAGRLLSPSVAQEAPNDPPYRLGAPTHLEGAFTNNLADSSFTSSYIPSGFLDPVPTGWTVQQSDPDALIRTAIVTETLLPTFEITWYLRPSFQDYTLAPPITIVTPPVAASEVFQAIFEPSPYNDTGTIQLVSNTGLVSTAETLLSGATALTLNVGADPGPVKIKWRQQDGSSKPQTLRLLAPMSSSYPTLHTFVPQAVPKAADVLTLQNVEFANKWSFSKGFIRVDSDQEEVGQPLSWSIKFQTGPVLLKVDGGILQSDFSTTTVNLIPLLATDPATRGSYKLQWTAGQPFKLVTRPDPEQSEQEVALVFEFDLTIPDLQLTDLINYEFKSFNASSGSSRLKHFSFKPE